MDMTGKTVLITGASRGIGASAAQVFAAQGANVALLARSAGAVEALASETGPRTLAIEADVSVWADMAAAVQSCVARFGRLDVLIGNAGVIEPIAPMASSDPAAWGHVIDINLKGIYYGMRAAMPVMEAQGGGTILTVSSGAAHNALDGWSHYCTSKAGAAMLTMCAHKEGAPNGLRAMGLSPGTVATQMQHEIKASGVNPVSQLDWSAHIPADWPARALLWMCGADADPYLGEEISLRDAGIRKEVGLT
ncbi:SDR family oxidoreductase [Roseovarius sp. LXJ103]|uniref:SDR family oxidoreductase n=1 Tax=Roseovarius carneus TaxID=2853164 RepID=UPI000D610416|nr:SDR family oxidoreductase [Roseovarius carneus]MBZ8118164.1 SDR family oxidoreductase [Roseovarius carneus]PWE37310.1 short-chain dehydrogenase [Pelagicola sp. LXJ1103]